MNPAVFAMPGVTYSPNFYRVQVGPIAFRFVPNPNFPTVWY